MSFFRKNLAFLFLLLFPILFFYKFFFHKLVPFPADITVGVYYPWLDYDWGFPTGVPVKNPLPSDIPSVIFPFKQLAVEIVKQGRLPDLNQFVLSGTPLLANGQSAVFYPLNLLYLLTDFVSAWSLLVIIQPILSSLFAYLAAREFKFSKLASLFTAFTYSYSAFFTTWLEYNIHGHVMALLPLIVYFWKRSTTRPHYWPLYAAALSVQILAGYPQFTLYTLGIIFFLEIFAKKSTVKSIFKLCLFTILGVGLSSLQLLPTFDFLSFSNRLYDSTTLLDRNQGFLPFNQLSTLVAPNIFGNPATYNYFGIGYFDNFVSYVGIIGIAFAIQSLGSKNRLTRALLWLSLVGLALSLRTPVSSFLQAKNFFGFGSAIAARALLIWSFAVSFLAGIGVDTYRAGKTVFIRKLYPLLIGLVPILFFGYSSEVLKNNSAVTDIYSQVHTGFRNAIPPAVFVGLFFTLTVLKTSKLKRNLIVALLLIFQLADLFLYGQKYLSFSSRHLVYPSTPAIEFLQANLKSDKVLFRDVIPMNMWVPYHLHSATGYDALYSAKYATFLGKLNGSGPLGRYGDVHEQNDTTEFSQTATKFVLAKKVDSVASASKDGHLPDQIAKNPQLIPVFEDNTVVVLKNSNYLPFIHAKIDNEIFPITDYSQHLNGDIYFNVNLPVESQINVSMQNLPSWRLKINGVDTELSSSPVFLSFPLKEGSHRVELTYHPRSFSWGVFVSIVSAITLLLLFLRFKKTSLSESKKKAYNVQMNTALSVKNHQNVPPDYYQKSIKENLLQRFWHYSRFKKALSLVERDKQAVILDIGSADGTFTKVLINKIKPKKLIGIDVLKSSVDYANKRFARSKHITFRVADAHKLPFKANTFSGIFCFEVLEHIFDPRKVLSEIRRVLKPNGYFVAIVPAENLLFKIIWWFWTKSKGRIWDEAHVQEFSNMSLSRLVRKSGMEVVHESTFLLGMLYIVKAVKPPKSRR